MPRVTVQPIMKPTPTSDEVFSPWVFELLRSWQSLCAQQWQIIQWMSSCDGSSSFDRRVATCEAACGTQSESSRLSAAQFASSCVEHEALLSNPPSFAGAPAAFRQVDIGLSLNKLNEKNDIIDELAQNERKQDLGSPNVAAGVACNPSPAVKLIKSPFFCPSAVSSCASACKASANASRFFSSTRKSKPAELAATSSVVRKDWNKIIAQLSFTRTLD